jgi:hypothetical protein
MEIKKKMLLKIGKKMGYDINNPKNIVYKTINDTIATSHAFMEKKEIINFLKQKINELEQE